MEPLSGTAVPWCSAVNVTTMQKKNPENDFPRVRGRWHARERLSARLNKVRAKKNEIYFREGLVLKRPNTVDKHFPWRPRKERTRKEQTLPRNREIEEPERGLQLSTESMAGKSQRRKAELKRRCAAGARSGSQKELSEKLPQDRTRKSRICSEKARWKL